MEVVHGAASAFAQPRIRSFRSNAKKIPDAIMTPKTPENPPRSRTWNQLAFTLTMATAPKLWKYMLTA